MSVIGSGGSSRHIGGMKRILALAVLAGMSIWPGVAIAGGKPFRVELTGDAYVGGGWMTGVRITLDEGWKTYWRMPGEAGMPPQFKWMSSVPAAFDVRYPLPSRYEDASGETVGYKHEVIFPVFVKADGATAVDVNLDLFFAVCRDICIPADARAAIRLGTATSDAAGSRDVDRWNAMVPQEGTPVTSAEVVTDGGRNVLKLVFGEPADDVFVESATSAYFGRPAFADDRRTATIPVENVKDAARLQGAALTVTVSSGGRGLEQRLSLP